MNILRKIQYDQFWNIGFSEISPEEFIGNKKLTSVKWLQHPYKDRWFADPFILKVTDDEIVVFVEECPIENPKGIICELVINRKTMRLKNRYVLLEKDTHLSYPAIIRQGGKVYVYPENGASGELNIYEYDELNHRLINPVCILNEALADATILEYDRRYYLSTTKSPETQAGAFLYSSDSLFGPYVQVSGEPYQISEKCSRQGGNWLLNNGIIYRPAQDCVERYGSALTIMKVTKLLGGICEKEYIHVNPVKGRYGLGIHTINFAEQMCVVDGFGHLLPFVGRIYYSSVFHRIVNCIKGRL